MKERPILFSGPMVRGILEGRKTMTRRVVKHTPAMTACMMEGEEGSWCPYGAPGDRLWVRETWSQVVTNIPRDYGFLYRADFSADADPSQWGGKWKPSIFMPRELSRILLEITNVRVERLQDITEADARAEGIEQYKPKDGSWTLVPFWKNYTWDGKKPTQEHLSVAKKSFQTLWQSINGPDSWEQNPWVWVIEFKRV